MLEHILFERLGGQNCSEIINQTRSYVKTTPLSRWYLRMRFWLHFGLHALTLRPVNHVYYIDSVYNYFTVSCQYLPPANVVCEGYVFTPVCDSVNRGGVRGCSWGVCVVAPGRGACMGYDEIQRYDH